MAELTSGGWMLRITETAGRAVGARLCFGKPVRHEDRTVIPVASVMTAGGLGFGSSEAEQDGGGGGGALTSRPVGFIEVTGDQARFRRIVTTADIVQLAAAATLAAGWLARRRLPAG